MVAHGEKGGLKFLYTATTVQVVQLATDPRCLIEINAIAIV